MTPELFSALVQLFAVSVVVGVVGAVAQNYSEGADVWKCARSGLVGSVAGGLVLVIAKYIGLGV